MAYGQIKVDTITFTDGGIDKSVSISGLVQNPTFSGNITVTGTISGNTLQGQTVSGLTVTGTTAQFASGTFTSLTGTTTTGTTASFATGVFTSITGTTATITSGIFASGTAAAPSVSVGTTDNGLYSPGADQVAISTNGTGRLFVDASGNVGINAASTGVVSTGIPVIEIKGNSAAQTDRTGGIRFTRYDGVIGAEIYNADGATYIDSKSPYPLIFYTGGGEKMVLNSSGRLGLGTSSPGFKLTIEDSTTPRIRIGDGVRHVNLDGGSATQNAAIGTDYTGSFGIYTNGAANTRLHITSAGLVGIGTTSPQALLEISSGVTDGPVLRLNNLNTSVNSGTEYGRIQWNANDSSGGGTGISAYIASLATNAGVEGALTFGTRAVSYTHLTLPTIYSV